MAKVNLSAYAKDHRWLVIGSVAGLGVLAVSALQLRKLSAGIGVGVGTAATVGGGGTSLGAPYTGTNPASIGPSDLSAAMQAGATAAATGFDSAGQLGQAALALGGNVLASQQAVAMAGLDTASQLGQAAMALGAGLGQSALGVAGDVVQSQADLAATIAGSQASMGGTLSDVLTNWGAPPPRAIATPPPPIVPPPIVRPPLHGMGGIPTPPPPRELPPVTQPPMRPGGGSGPIPGHPAPPYVPPVPVAPRPIPTPIVPVAPRPAPPPVKAVRYYTVKAGDNLHTIAASQMGTSNAWPSLYAANRAAIGSNPNLIHIGLRLVIP